MHTSQAGIALIKRNEGCKLTAYLDRIADPPVWTIGWGDTLDVHEGMTITQRQAEDRLSNRLAREFEPGVLAALAGAPVTQPQFDALVSLAWNIGVEAIKGSAAIHYHRAGSYQAAADQFRLWVQSGGSVIPALVRRREEERALYLSGSSIQTVPGTQHPFGSASVEALQRALVDLGYAVAVDGDPGPQTCGAALAAIQQSQAAKAAKTAAKAAN